MLTVDSKARADMTEVILCLSAIYSGRPLPPRKKSSKPKKKEGEPGEEELEDSERVGVFRTDGQGILEKKKKKKKEGPSEVSGSKVAVVEGCQGAKPNPHIMFQGKKLASDSAAARRLRGRSMGDSGKSPSPGESGEQDMFDASFSAFAIHKAPSVNDELAFSTDQNHFSDPVRATEGSDSFEAGSKSFDVFGGDSSWSGTSELRRSATQVTADGFPATGDRSANGSMTERMADLDISEEDPSRRRRDSHSKRKEKSEIH
jgi:hypothetical protein